MKKSDLTAKEQQTLDRFLNCVKQNAEWRTRILGLLDWAADAMALPSDMGTPYPTRLGTAMTLTGRQAGALKRFESVDDAATKDFARATLEKLGKILDARDAEEELILAFVVALAICDE